MKKEKVWKANPGKKAKPNRPDRMVWLRFRHRNEDGTHVESPIPRRAGDYIWLDRGELFDIIAAAEE